ncbi:RlmE family RNA methyltransferase [Alphaproteobacteria bacterium]|nr:RlmE family RNA methyltransferase [Alphaproteobacteria bacterium]MDG1414358.1 RlmE family RNA methyltransferase [Alphaproteobacteria bacterium]
MVEYKPKRTGSSGRIGGAPGQNRDLAVRVKSARGRKNSSTRWLQRQLNDPYVAAAKRDGYRGRAAYKLLEMNDKLKFLAKGKRVVDLGCAPGGWLQVAVQHCGEGKVVGIDLLQTEPVAGAEIIVGDVRENEDMDRVRALMHGQKADIVLSDMAASSTGHKATDHLRIIALIEISLDFAHEVLAEGGWFIVKILQGGAQGNLQQTLGQCFDKVRVIKPPASRSDSSEAYIAASGYRPGAVQRADSPEES